ncbi:hypothetical protein [Novosphingopyxis sp.]
MTTVGVAAQVVVVVRVVRRLRLTRRAGACLEIVRLRFTSLLG